MRAEQINEPCQLGSAIKPSQQAAAHLLLSRQKIAVGGRKKNKKKNPNCNLSPPLLIKSVSTCCSTVSAKFLVPHGRLFLLMIYLILLWSREERSRKKMFSCRGKLTRGHVSEAHGTWSNPACRTAFQGLHRGNETSPSGCSSMGF